MLYKRKLYLFWKNHLCICSYASCLSLAQISKTLKKTFSKTFLACQLNFAVVVWVNEGKYLNIFKSHPEVFLGKGILKICSKFTGEHPCRSVVSIKLLYTLTWMFSCKFAAYFRRPFIRTPMESCFCQYSKENTLNLKRKILLYHPGTKLG